MKTTLELPDALFRETKAFAARKGLSLRQVVVEALARQIRAEQERPEAKPWLKAFRNLSRDKELAPELGHIRARIEAEFERIDPQDWK
jgi:hypothetical protein